MYSFNNYFFYHKKMSCINIKTIIILFSSFLTFIMPEPNEKLIFVMTHFRHGARASSHLDDDGYDLCGEYWDIKSRLTGVGSRMHYILGYRNRLRYVNDYKFISEKYNQTEIKAICSLKERSQQSLHSHMQGFFPQNEDLGEVLNEIQKENSNPPINISNPLIEEKIKALENFSLPNSMSVPIFEVENLIEYKDCRGEGTNDSKNVLEIENEFNEKYKEKYNEFRGSNDNYTFEVIADITVDFLCDYADGRKLEKFLNYFDKEEFLNFSKRTFTISQSERKVTSNATEYAFGNYFAKLLIDYTKLKIDEDLGKSSEEENPKMIIISGHDNTMATHHFFLQYALGKSNDFFRTPFFAAQMAFEIKRSNDKKENRNYSDYFINYFFNDELILNMSITEFLEKVEPHIMTDDELNKFCGLDQEENNTDNDGDNNDGNENNVKYIPYEVIKYRNSLVIIFASLFGVSLLLNALAIYAIYSLMKKNNSEQIQNSKIEVSDNNFKV